MAICTFSSNSHVLKCFSTSSNAESSGAVVSARHKGRAASESPPPNSAPVNLAIHSQNFLNSLVHVQACGQKKQAIKVDDDMGVFQACFQTETYVVWQYFRVQDEMKDYDRT